MTCIESVHFDISINGHISEGWYPHRGIRQGDPLSPYIFIVCINFLILKFINGHRLGEFDGMQINKNTPSDRYLMFSDDCIIFCRSNNKSIEFIKNTMGKFEEEAGLSINWNKTKAYFSKNTPNNIIWETSKSLEIKTGNVGEKHLGLPLIIRMVTKETFIDISIKTQAKISNWYNKFLSHAGRSTLIHHILNTIPHYTMSTHIIPLITMNKINSINKKFMWNSSNKTNKRSLIKWDTICTPKYLGGLSIINKAYTLKMAWRLFNEENTRSKLVFGL